MIGMWLRAGCVLLTIGVASAAASAQTLVLKSGTLYATPEAPPLPDAVIVATGGVVTAVGKAGEVQIPEDARVIDCTGKTVVAGFWNSHVHFTEAVWINSADKPAAVLTAHMQQMLTQWGFTTVWDLGSHPDNALPLRRRIGTGEIPGPAIFLAGNVFPKDGHPAYLPPELKLPMADTPEQSAQWARTFLDLGLDGMKLFTGVWKGEANPIVNMDVAVAKAAVDEAHARGKPVFAHPQNAGGVDTVISAGVDVMAHTASHQRGPYTAEQLARFKAQNIALVPTLTVFSEIPAPADIVARIVDNVVGQLRSFSENGGPILFGTDVGYIKVYDTTREYELMRRVLSERQILASLTTNPAIYFKATRKGRVEQGFDADLVILDADPLTDVRNLARVAMTIRAGQIIFQKP